MPRISVIMPVYNVEPFLRECLDSVRAQTFADWECLCVDDGSTDGSPAILDEYAARDGRFRVFRRKHSNAGAVRNFGMKEAKGDFLCFLDSDDVFSPWMFETLFGKADKEGADIVACTFRWFADGTPPPVFGKPENIVWEDRTPDSEWSNSPLSAGTMPWNKILRRAFVVRNAISFLEQKTTNDMTFMALALALSGKTFKTETVLGGYRQRMKSLQAIKGRSPRNCLRAHSAFLKGLETRGIWETLSDAGKRRWFLFYAGGVVWELSSQITARGYLSLYTGIIGQDRRDAISKRFPIAGKRENGKIGRYRDIVKGGFSERRLALKEALLCPLNANRDRAKDLRSIPIRIADWITIRLFGRPGGRKPLSSASRDVR